MQQNLPGGKKWYADTLGGAKPLSSLSMFFVKVGSDILLVLNSSATPSALNLELFWICAAS